MATIKAKEDFDVKQDCRMLHSIFNATGSKQDLQISGGKEKYLTEFFTTRSYAQRMDVVTTYRDLYSRYLAQDIRANVTGPYRYGLLTLVCPYGVRHATSVHKSLTKLGVDEHTLLEVICSRNWDHLQELAENYAELFNQDLAKVIKSELSGKFQLQVLKLMRERRSEAGVDPIRAKETVRDLHEAAYGRWGKNKLLIFDIFNRESFKQLRHVFVEYEKLYEETVHKLVYVVFNGELRKMVTYLARYIESEIGFYSFMLHKAATGEVCDKSILHKAVMGHSSQIAAFTRIILYRCDIDLHIIIAAYEKEYQSSLKKDICQYTSGDLRDLLLAACGW